jgi:hypothetical protein
MIDRVNFLESVQGIQYPDMLANFFDHFIALILYCWGKFFKSHLKGENRSWMIGFFRNGEELLRKCIFRKLT